MAEPFLVKVGRMFAQGRDGTAEAALQERLRREPDQRGLWLELADLRESQGDYQGAVAAYQGYLAGGEDWKVRAQLDLLRERMGKFTDARTGLLELNREHPGDPDILWGLAQTCLYQSRWKGIRTQPSAREALKEARGYLVELKAARPGFALGLWQLAGVYRDLGERARALRAYEQVLRRDASYKTAYRHMARLLARMGNYSRALDDYERAMAIEPRNDALRKEARRTAKKAPRAAQKRKKERLQQWEAWKPPVETFIAASPITIRVGLATHLGRLVFRGVSDLKVTTPAQTPVTVLKAGKDYVASYVPASRSPDRREKWVLKDRRGDVLATFSHRVWIEPMEPDKPLVLHAVTVNKGYFFAKEEDRAYRGILEFSPRPGRGFNVINRVSLEDYTAGVLPAEMVSGWPMEALKAQAIVARTYVLSKRGQYNDEGFDVCDSVMCQVYGGLRSEQPRTDRAVRETAGLVLEHDAKVMPVVFSAQCGGHTQDYEEAWGYKAPVVGVSDFAPGSNPGMEFPLSPARMADWIKEDHPAYCNVPDLRGYQNFRWASMVSASAIEARVPDIGRVKRLIVTRRSTAGWAEALRVEGEKGDREIKGDVIRRFLGGIRSNLIWIEPQFDPKGWPEEFIIYGGGWGHGVGMCQVGCYGLAKAGWKCRDILRHYFPEGDIRKLDKP